jgi:excisionase family DNA binding protein
MRTSFAWVKIDISSEPLSPLTHRLKEPGSVRIDATRLPPRCGPTFFVAVDGVDAGVWLDRQASPAPIAARTATVATVVTKRSRHPDCPFKNCPGGQEVGRSKDCVQWSPELQFFVQFDASHRFDTGAASFLASVSAREWSSYVARSKTNPHRRNDLVSHVLYARSLAPPVRCRVGMQVTDSTPEVVSEPRIGRSVSLDHAAQLLGVSRRTIYNRIRDGRLQTIRTPGGSQRVLLDSVQVVRSQAAERPARSSY